MKRLTALLAVATLSGALLLPAYPASAQEEGAVAVEVGPRVQAVAGGHSLLVTVEVVCEPGL